MARPWSELTRLTGGRPIQVERVRLTDTEGEEGPVIEGRFELPPLADLPEEDQLFVAAFVKSHGSIKAMERLFGVSYPTVKNRLNRIGERFPMLDVEGEEGPGALERLASGEISVDEAVTLLREAGR